MSTDPSLYNEKLEKKYFYLPKICRKTNRNSNELHNNGVS